MTMLFILNPREGTEYFFYFISSKLCLIFSSVDCSEENGNAFCSNPSECIFVEWVDDEWSLALKDALIMLWKKVDFVDNVRADHLLCLVNEMNPTWQYRFDSQLMVSSVVG
jgi:hypothetical protein